ncbi:MAG: hypothetical protein LC620_01410, partial [Halobacteriales archaeon]|nr:hypothetical protein [Halobacteriales archaeon]
VWAGRPPRMSMDTVAAQASPWTGLLSVPLLSAPLSAARARRRRGSHGLPAPACCYRGGGKVYAMADNRLDTAHDCDGPRVDA